MQWATEKRGVEAVLGRRLEVRAVAANPVAQTAAVSYDPERTSVAELAQWVRDSGFHCRGQSVPRRRTRCSAHPSHARHPHRAVTP